MRWAMLCAEACRAASTDRDPDVRNGSKCADYLLVCNIGDARALEVQRQRRSRPVQKFAVLLCMVANWRATADEDGQYCFAVAL
jgi:hypothetical protein